MYNGEVIYQKDICKYLCLPQPHRFGRHFVRRMMANPNIRDVYKKQISKPRICELCGKSYIPTSLRQKYCGSQTLIGSCSKKRWKRKHNHSYFFRSALKRKKHFALSKEKFNDLKSIRKCCYCGRDGQLMTIDRKDNNIGYTDDNCVASCHFCNNVKGGHYKFEQMMKIGHLMPEYNSLNQRIKKIREEIKSLL